MLTGIELKKTYQLGEVPVTVLDGVNIDIKPKEITAVVGPSGTGKSTLLYVLAGLEKPEHGKVLLDGKDLYSMSDVVLSRLRAETFGFVFQSFNLIPTMTALENVELIMHLTASPRATIRAQEMLERVGLGPRLHHRPGQLSGGEQQRVALARALVQNPRILFADEPTGNLDHGTGQEMMSLIISLVREHDTACLLVTHNLEWAEMADKVVSLKRLAAGETA